MTDGATTGHCPGCGVAVGGCDGCLPELDPPRYCTECGGWLTVRVSTGGWTARCRKCEAETASGPARRA